MEGWSVRDADTDEAENKTLYEYEETAMKFHLPMKTSQIKKTVLKAVAQYLDDHLPEDGETYGYQDEALDTANAVYDDAIKSGNGAAIAKKEARIKFFEEIEELICGDLVDGISGCFDSHKE